MAVELDCFGEEVEEGCAEEGACGEADEVEEDAVEEVLAQDEREDACEGDEADDEHGS